MKRQIFDDGKIILKAALVCSILLLASGDLLAQYKGFPVKKEKLINVLRSRQLQTREIVRVIKTNGVDFEVNSAVENELRLAGARPEVIDAARANYRQMTAGKSKPSTDKKFTGEPLDKDLIVKLLENGVADAQVRKNVESRGVSFKPNAQINSEIKKAGGSVALVNLIRASFVDPNQNSASNNSDGNVADASGDYQELVGKAVDQYENQKNTTAALTTLQEAVKAEPEESRAYQLLGYMTLYGQKNFAEAEKYMREAVTRGGSAVFRVFHDHDGLFGDTCQGSLYVARDTVRFESDDNKHTFETDDANIKQVKMNSIFKTFYKTKSGSFKVILKSGETDSVKFSFAPLTDNALESKMIIRLIGKDN